ncbi:hypothetical protein ABW636_17470 [Aquimarina sp. 2201CG1-2-11]|uniref:hypothetical protein n=1 Tax=Aquimarina discodermiae TaxID=3231043 RepID=UPI0034623FD4
MNLIEKYIESSNSIEYYKDRIDKLSIKQREELENLLEKMNNSGAKEPLSWALSEITENIPQFGRFLFLKELYGIINGVEENMGFADDIDENYEEDIFEVAEKLKKSIGEKELNDFLKSYARGIMWQVTNQIDGTYNSSREVVWALKEVKDGANERFISGLHENFNEFEDELE